MLLLGTSCVFGQVSLSLASGSAVTGGTVSLDLSMNATSQPAGLQWTYSYSATDFTSVGVVAGPAAVAAGKVISCNGSPGSYTCLLFGLNSTTVGSGVIATATFAVSPATTSTSSAIQIINDSAASINDSPESVMATGGQVTISPLYRVSAFTCAPATVTTPGSATCTVSASVPAPAGGLTVTTGLGAAVGSITMPSSVTIAAGSPSAGFTVNASTVSAATTAFLVASLNGTSQSFSMTLAPPPPPPPPPAPALAGLACSSATLLSHTSDKCAVTLVNPAPSGGVTIALSSGRLSAPSSVLIPAGSTSAQFSVSVGNINTTQTVTLVAALNGASRSFSITLTASTGKHH